MRQSMRKKMLLLYIGLAVLLLLVTVICNYEGIVNLNRQMNDLDQSVLKEYAAQTAANLSAVESNIQSFTSFDNDVASMQYLDDEAESLFATTRVLRRMKGDAIEYPDMSCEFLYTMYKENTLIVRGEKQSYEEKRRLDRAVADICKDTTMYASLVWNNYQIEGNNYLLYGCQMDDNYFAILIRPEELTQIPFTSDEQQNVSCGLYLQDELIAGEEIAEGKGLTAQIGSTGLTLRVDLQRTFWQNNILWLSVMLVMVPVLLLIAAFLIYRFSTTDIVQPLDKISTVMRRLGQGDMDARIDTNGMGEEFALIGQVFNDAVDRINEMRDNEKEMLRERQAIQLRNLEMQINPHFLGNCFNAIYNASLTEDVDHVLALTTYLNRYFRFMAQVEKEYVTLEEELRFTEDFLAIQKLRFGDAFDYTIKVPMFLRQSTVPPSVIKSFAENAVKYARESTDTAKLEIRAALEQGAEAKIRIEIEDNGPGFPPEILNTLQQDKPLVSDGRTHIGITNVKKRIQLLYQEHAELHIENMPEGAKVVVLLPLEYGPKE